MVFRTKTCASLVSALVKSISDKRAAKKRKFLANIVFLDVRTTVHHTFPSSELRCLPRGYPKNLCVNTRIRLLATHSLNGVLAIWAHKHAGKRMVSVNNCCLQLSDSSFRESVSVTFLDVFCWIHWGTISEFHKWLWTINSYRHHNLGRFCSHIISLQFVNHFCNLLGYFLLN